MRSGYHYKKSLIAKDERLLTLIINNVLPVSVRYRIQACALFINDLHTCQEFFRRKMV